MRKIGYIACSGLALIAVAGLGVPALAGPKSIRVEADGTARTINPDGTTRVAAEVSNGLPPIDLSTMRLWKYSEPWHASNWANAFSDTPWVYNRVKQNGTDVVLTLDRTGAPELKANSGSGQTRGTWEAEVTVPTGRSGLDVAYFLYNDASKDEIDFEFVANKGLLLSIHSYRTGSHQTFSAPMIQGSWAGRRVRLGMKADLAAGWIDMLVNGAVVYRFTRNATPKAFPETPVRPIFNMWSAKAGLKWAEQWLGKWTPLKSGAQLQMVVHGYRFTA